LRTDIVAQGKEVNWL